MAAYLSDDPKQLDELFKKDGEGYLLVGYLFIPENDGCACPYRGYCQERIYQPVLSALCP